jgi:hypothetical protein
MRNFVVGLALAVVGVVAQAGGTASISCGVSQFGQAPVLSIKYLPSGDSGTPGLFFLGALTPNQQAGAVMTPKGWLTYEGGLYPFQARYDTGLPGSISLEVPLPDGASTTAAYVGFGIYAGHGAYTTKGRAAVAERRASLNEAKAVLVADGMWNSEFNSDERYIYSLVQKDMVDNRKYGLLLTIPFVDCRPQSGGNN